MNLREIILSILFIGWIGLSMIWDTAPQGHAFSFAYALLIIAYAKASETHPVTY
jgi:hypothetical protein